MFFSRVTSLNSSKGHRAIYLHSSGHLGTSLRLCNTAALVLLLSQLHLPFCQGKLPGCAPMQSHYTPHLEGADCFPPKIRNKKRMSSLSTSSPHCTRGSSQANWQENKIKVIQIEKEEVKLPLFLDDMIFLGKKF